MTNKIFEDINPDTIEMAIEMFDVFQQGDEWQEMTRSVHEFKEVETYLDELLNLLKSRIGSEHHKLINTIRDVTVAHQSVAETVALAYALKAQSDLHTILQHPVEFLNMKLASGMSVREHCPIE